MNEYFRVKSLKKLQQLFFSDFINVISFWHLYTLNPSVLASVTFKCWLVTTTLVQLLPRCGPQTSAVLLWLLSVSFLQRRNPSSRRWSVLQGWQEGKGGQTVPPQRAVLFGPSPLFFTFYNIFIIELSSCTCINRSEQLWNIISRLQKARRTVWPGQGCTRKAEAQPEPTNLGLPVAQSFPSTSSHFSHSIFPQLFPLILSYYPAKSAFDFSFFSPDHSYFNSNYFSLLLSTLSQAHQEHAWPSTSILFWCFPKLITHFSVSALLFHLIHSS